MRINLNTRNGYGFGDYLCLISVLCDISDNVELYCDNKEHQHDRIKELLEIFNVPETKIKLIFSSDHKGDFSGAWNLKSVSNYYQPEYINIDGEQIKVKQEPKAGRNFIGLACYSGLDFYLDKNYDLIRGSTLNEGNNGTRIPQCKFRSIDTYSKVFEMCRVFGYDVITLDHPGNLKQKIKFMVENCAAVIAYEGGIAHLCHMLGIPCIMFNYRQPNSDSFYGPFQLEFMHQSDTMYLIRRDDELFNMSRQQFYNLISDLRYSKKTNNSLITGEHRLQFTKGANSKVDFLNRESKVVYRSQNGPQISETARTFIEHYYKDKFPYLNT